MINLHGDAVDPTDFPGGLWPKSNTGQSSDATAKTSTASTKRP